MVALVLGATVWPAKEEARGQGGRDARLQYGPAKSLSQILGRPTGDSVTLSVLLESDIETYVEFGDKKGSYSRKTGLLRSNAGSPFEFKLERLQPDTRYFYRLCSRRPGQDGFAVGDEYTFHTQRRPGSTFTFALQGDSHPERSGKMYSPDLYVQTMRNVEKDRPDFYLTMGDDFSLDRLVNRRSIDQSNVDRVYTHQRSFLGIVGRSSPLFLVNGNHEQAGANWLDGTPNNPAVMAGIARNRFFALPAPDNFYSGDKKEVEFVGLLRDYYAWTWGDALFVVMDPYWHSPVPVDSAQGGERSGRERRESVRDESRGAAGGGRRVGAAGGGRRVDRSEKDNRGAGSSGGRRGGERRDGSRGEGRSGSRSGRERDWWKMSIGNEQYAWLKDTLEQSKARYKFVFCHHVMGTGRGGIEMAHLYEWGGKSRDGTWQFDEKRPNWEKPILQLMVDAGVTIFFQGHDHLFCRQELDGVVYQSVPNPADDTYQAFNREAYRTGDVLPNSGHLLVTVSPENVRLDYVRSFLPEDKAEGENGKTAFAFTVPAKPLTGE
jgi:hypothetical protein